MKVVRKRKMLLSARYKARCVILWCPFANFAFNEKYMKMKNIINKSAKMALLMGTSVLASSCVENRPSLLDVELDGMEANDSVLIVSQNRTDTVAAPNGKFVYEYSDSIAGMVRIFNYPRKGKDGKVRAVRMVPVNVLMFPNVSVDVKGTFDDFMVEGGDFYTEYNQMCTPLDACKRRMTDLMNELRQLKQSEQATPEAMKALKLAYQKAQEEHTEQIERYVRTHLDSEVSLFLLYSYFPEFGTDCYMQLSDAVKNGRMKPIYDKVAASYEMKIAKKKAAAFIQEGKPAPDFTLKDIQGNDFTLSSLRGKYVILDFWGSWCGWCIKGMPDMKKAYEKYQNKMEIVGVDCRDTDEKWKAAVERLGIHWTQVANSTEQGKDLTVTYNVSGYPTKLILSPDGTILKIVVGEDPAFYDVLDELMKG